MLVLCERILKASDDCSDLRKRVRSLPDERVFLAATEFLIVLDHSG